MCTYYIYILVIAILVAGFGLGWFIKSKTLKRSMYGEIVIDDTNPEKDLFTLDFSKNPGLLYDEKIAIFKIVKAEKSQK